jgi:hypothetical protein
MAKETARGTTGNAKNSTIPLRQWSAPSYNADTGRAHSSVAQQNRNDYPLDGNHAGKCSAQIPGGFKHLDKARTQDPRPVRDREQTKVRE